MTKYAIDDGHGDGSSPGNPNGYDPGACANGYKEADITLKLGNMLRSELTRRGHKCFKPTGAYTTRAAKADAWGADALVSLHLNAGPESAHGTETFIHTGASTKSLHMAQAIQARLPLTLGTTNRGVNSSHGFAVTAGKCPAALIENVFITNSTDLKKLLTHMPEAASAIADALEAVFGKGTAPTPTRHKETALRKCRIVKSPWLPTTVRYLNQGESVWVLQTYKTGWKRTPEGYVWSRNLA